MHQFVDGSRGEVLTEELFADRIVRFLYSRVRERAPKLFALVTSARMSSLLGFLNFDLPLASRLLGNRRFLARCGVDLGECLESAAYFTTPRRIFERKIRYWQCRPMPVEQEAVVSPADARMLLGSLAEDSHLFIKEKFFSFPDLLGHDKRSLLAAFAGGDFAIFRLTPDKYHYNHLPVSGRVKDIYKISGCYHSCNPEAVVEMVTPYSMNKRLVTVLDTDVPGGTGVGLVAMIEVVAMMIGEVVQCYSDHDYDFPLKPQIGMFLKKGQPKSLYRPGSSTDILLFQKDRVRFSPELVGQRQLAGVQSRFSVGFGQCLTESEVRVRSLIAMATEEKRGRPWHI